MMNNISDNLTLLDRDVGSAAVEAGGVHLQWGVFHAPGVPLWRSDIFFEPDTESIQGFEDGEVVLAIDRNVRALSESDPTTTLLIEVAEALAEEVMDRLNRPWPELIDGTAVLSPTETDDGRVVWSGGGWSIPLGDLKGGLVR